MPIPKLDIGLPVYNGENFLREAIDSLLNQSYPHFELIISDNASTDETEAICREYAARDKRIRYFRNPTNIGAAQNFCRVFELAREDAEFFKWAAHDDVHLPGFLARCMEVMQTASPQVVLVCPRIFLIDGEGQPLVEGDRWLVERLATSAPSPHGRLAEILPKLKWSAAQFGVLRARAVRRTRKLEAFYASDQVLLAELAILGEFVEIDAPLFARRFHAGMSTLENATPEKFALWMDPNATGKAFQRRRIASEYIRSIRRFPLSPIEKGRCIATVSLVWLRQRVRRARGLSKNY